MAGSINRTGDRSSRSIVSDNNGLIAFDLPELMNTSTWFYVRGHGYSVKKDGFGYRGVRVTPVPGKTITIKVRRELAAKRLGRLTGAGLFAESQKLGESTDWKDQRILGCDSVQNVVVGERLFWSWGDTNLANYPLGRFHMIGATTTRQPLKSMQPPIELRFDYFTDKNEIPRNIAEMPGAGPTWLSGFINLPDKNGKLQLGATYSKIKDGLTEYEKGLCVWNDDTKNFDRLKVVWKKTDQQPTAPPMPHGHPVSWTDGDKKSWMLFGDPFPTIRCHATYEHWSNPSSWESTSAPKRVAVDGSNQSIKPHRGAIAWNGYLKKWVTVFTQLNGDSSVLGEIWYAESKSPLGPWGNAIKVVTHDKYSFYNPQIHVDFVKPNSPILLFEGTYTTTFSKAKSQTARYDYNQILYRLDLDETPFAKSSSK